MSRRKVLSEAEKQSLINLPKDFFTLSKYYLLSEVDISRIKQKRGVHNKLGFAILLCCMRYPGSTINVETNIPDELIEFIARQLNIKDHSGWRKYFNRDSTRWEQISELKLALGLRSFTAKEFNKYLRKLVVLAKQTDKGGMIAEALIKYLRQDNILIPDISVIERIASEAITIGSKEFYIELTKGLPEQKLSELNELLKIKPSTKISYLAWLQQPANIPKPKHILLHIERLHFIKELNLPDVLGKNVHHNRLIKLAKEGRNMFARDIQKLEQNRRHATILAIILETKASIIDEIIELNDKILSSIFNKAKNNHHAEFHTKSKSINEKLNVYLKVGHALIAARQNNVNAFQAIETVISWEEFTRSINDTQQLAKPTNFDSLYKLSSYYPWIKRYVLKFLDILDFKVSENARELLSALLIVRNIHKHKLRKIPRMAPTNFIRKQWYDLVFKEHGEIDRQYYEIAVLSELKNALRSGDVWVVGSRKYKDFDAYLVDKETFNTLKIESALPIVGNCSFNEFIKTRTDVLTEFLDEVNALAGHDELEDATVNDKGLKILPLINAVPDDAVAFSQKVSNLLPRVKITRLLQEVDNWVHYSAQFIHLKNDKTAPQKELLLTVILADAINLGLTKMAEACPGTTYAKLSSLQAWYIREETYKQATAFITNTQHQQHITEHWKSKDSASSDGQRFKAGNRGSRSASVNPKYGNEPGVTYYSHTSDVYASFYINVITSNLRDSTYVLDGLLYHEADINIYEHYTDTAGFSDHVFALMHLLGFKFAPRIRDLQDKRIYLPGKSKQYPHLTSIIGGSINLNLIKNNWDQIMRLALSIQNGTVTSSLILRKLGSYQRKNKLAAALAELGKIERSIFMLEWIKDPKLRRRVQAGLNKGEAKHGLTRAVHFNRLGEIRDRTLENQLHRASGLNLVVSAIILWNTIHITKAVDYLRKTDPHFNEDLIKHLSPLGWEHINLTGDYIWDTKPTTKNLPLKN